MSEAIRYEPTVKTRDIVQLLIAARDQVLTTADLVDKLDLPSYVILAGLRRLEKVSRVAQIHPNMWHLE